MNHRKLVNSIQSSVLQIVTEKEYTLETMYKKIKEEKMDSYLSILTYFLLAVVANLFITYHLFNVSEYTIVLKVFVGIISLSCIVYFIFSTKKDIAKIKTLNSVTNFDSNKLVKVETEMLNELLTKQEGANLQPVGMKKQMLVYNEYVKSLNVNKVVEQYILAKEYIEQTNLLVKENKKISIDEFTKEYVKKLNLNFRHALALHDEVVNTEEKKLVLLTD